MKPYATALLALLAMASPTLAQEQGSTPAAKQINSIKASKKYLYAESTTKDWTEAYANAKDVLASRIEMWLKDEGKNANAKGFVAKVGNNIQEIKTQRGNLYRAFVYIKKDDIMTYTGSDDFVVSTNTGGATQAQAAPSGGEGEMLSSIAPVEQARQTNAEEQAMLALAEPSELQGFLKAHASAYGKLATMPTGQPCYILVFSKTKIEACLAHGADGTEQNLRTLQADSIDNYKGAGMGAVWFQLKQ